MSGSLHLSPPMPHQLGKGILQTCEARAQELEGKPLRECSQKMFKQILTENNLSRCWMQEEDVLADWENKQEQVEELMIGETEFEVPFLFPLPLGLDTELTYRIVSNMA